MTHPVLIEDNAIRSILPLIETLSPAHTVIITDSNVGPLHAQALIDALRKQHISSTLLTVKAGESSKSRDTKAWLEDAMADLGCGRDTVLIALGGGMITDLAGFVAATYCRGIPFIALPTSLMAMVDASLGGKNGINTAHGKNKIGTIRPPHAVIIQQHYLETLPFDQYHMALSEVVKHALIADRHLFKLLQENTRAILDKDAACIAFMISRSVAIKMRIVNDDLHEHNRREILNFGHTIGHAIEHASDYAVTHGQAVGLGLLYESRLSHQMGHLAEAELLAIEALLSDLSLLKVPDCISHEKILAALQHDKKNRLNSMRCVLLTAVAHVLTDKGSSAYPVSQCDIDIILSKV